MRGSGRPRATDKKPRLRGTRIRVSVSGMLTRCRSLLLGPFDGGLHERTEDRTVNTGKQKVVRERGQGCQYSILVSFLHVRSIRIDICSRGPLNRTRLQNYRWMLSSSSDLYAVRAIQRDHRVPGVCWHRQTVESDGANGTSFPECFEVVVNYTVAVDSGRMRRDWG